MFKKIKRMLLVTATVVTGTCIALSVSACDLISSIFSKETLVEFGSYPQALVTDSATTSALEGLAGTLPTESDSASWTSYNYYLGTGTDGSQSNSTDYMWYIDLTYGEDTYRGVYFTSYRPYYTSTQSSAGKSYQDDNGYSTNTLYWFKYEPIKWQVLAEEEVDGVTYQTILCKSAIDSQAFQNTYKQSGDYCYQTFSTGGYKSDEDGKWVYANNYSYSTIRTWLNNTFYNLAFSETEKSSIQTVEVDNSYDSTYGSTATQDNVWLFGYTETHNADYGYTTSSSADEALEKTATDYAKCQGAYTSTKTDYAGNTYWWLRYGSNYSNVAHLVGDDGSTGNYNYVTTTSYGVCPALKIIAS